VEHAAAAAAAVAPEAYGYFSAGIGAGIVTIGAALGIGKIAGMAVDGTARQPEAANDIRSSMIITAAFIEGVALFGQVVCFLLATK
jgi:F-type H+-transporting ATPase subunit c